MPLGCKRKSALKPTPNLKNGGKRADIGLEVEKINTAKENVNLHSIPRGIVFKMFISRYKREFFVNASEYTDRISKNHECAIKHNVNKQSA